MAPDENTDWEDVNFVGLASFLKSRGEVVNEKEATAEQIKEEVDVIWQEILALVKFRRLSKSFGNSIDFLIEGRVYSFLNSQHALKCENRLLKYQESLAKGAVYEPIK